MSPRRETDMDAADTFLPLVLGVQSLLGRFDRVLELVPPEAAVAGEGATLLHPTDRSTIHLLLGLIALRDKLGAHLDEASSHHKGTPILDATSDTRTTGIRSRNLLR